MRLLFFLALVVLVVVMLLPRVAAWGRGQVGHVDPSAVSRINQSNRQGPAERSAGLSIWADHPQLTVAAVRSFDIAGIPKAGSAFWKKARPRLQQTGEGAIDAP